MRSCHKAFLFLLTAPLIAPLAVRAQTSDSDRHQSHVRIESAGNSSDAARLFTQRLQELQKSRALDWTEAEQKKIARFLEGQNLNDREEVFKKLADDDEIRKLVEKYARQPGAAEQLNKELRPEKLETFKSVIEELKKKKGDPLSVPPRTGPAGKSGTEPERQSDPSSNNQQREDPSNPAAGPSHFDPASHNPDHLRAEADARQQLHRFGDFLDDTADRFRDSPAVSKALRDLSKQTLTQDAGGAESLQEQLARFNRYTQRADGWVDSGRSFFGRLDLPGLPKIKAPRMDLPTPNLPSFNAPAMNVPDVGSENAWSAILWAVVVAAFGLVLWKLWGQWRAEGSGDSNAGWKLGPWPVNPARIATAAELIRAFEHLSLLRFGQAALTWNHLDVAAGLTEKQPELQQAAHDLAAVYEQARYAPADDFLTDEAIFVARQNLCFLAGVTAL